MAKIDSFEVSITNLELSSNLEGRSIAEFVLRKVQEFQTQRGSVNFLVVSQAKPPLEAFTQLELVLDDPAYTGCVLV